MEKELPMKEVPRSAPPYGPGKWTEVERRGAKAGISPPPVDVPNKSAEKPIHMQQQQRQYEQRKQKQQPEQLKQQQR